MRYTDEVIFEGARGCEPKFLSITVPNNLGGKDRDKYYAEYVFHPPSLNKYFKEIEAFISLLLSKVGLP